MFAETKVFRLSKRLSVEMTAGAEGFTAEWIPGLPDTLTEKELRRYRVARAEMLAKVAEKTGRPVVVIET